MSNLSLILSDLSRQIRHAPPERHNIYYQLPEYDMPWVTFFYRKAMFGGYLVPVSSDTEQGLVVTELPGCLSPDFYPVKLTEETVSLLPLTSYPDREKLRQMAAKAATTAHALPGDWNEGTVSFMWSAKPDMFSKANIYGKAITKSDAEAASLDIQSRLFPYEQRPVVDDIPGSVHEFEDEPDSVKWGETEVRGQTAEGIILPRRRDVYYYNTDRGDFCIVGTYLSPNRKLPEAYPIYADDEKKLLYEWHRHIDEGIFNATKYPTSIEEYYSTLVANVEKAPNDSPISISEIENKRLESLAESEGPYEIQDLLVGVEAYGPTTTPETSNAPTSAQSPGAATITSKLPTVPTVYGR